MRSPIAAAFLLLVSFGAYAQPAPVVEAIEQAEVLAGEGNHAEALRRIEGAKAACDAEPDADDCNSLLQYAAGYFLQFAASSTESADEAQKHREAAVQAYAASLRLQARPEVALSLATLLRDMGKHQEAIPLLQQAAKLDPEGAGLYYNLMGEAVAKAGDFDQAEQFFRSAIAEDPSNEDYRLNLLLLFTGGYDKLDPAKRTARLRTLLADARQLQRDGSGFASVAYDEIIDSAFRTDEAIALEALCGRLDVAAAERTLDTAIAAVDSDWKPAALEQIRKVIANPENAKTLAPWWLAKPLPKHTLASVLLALAADAHNNDDPQRAVSILQLTLGDIAPVPKTYMVTPELAHLRGKQVPYFQAAIQLSGLYVEEKQRVDPNGIKAGLLSSGLSFRAAGAALRGDYLTLQRLYTIVGNLEFETGSPYGWVGAEGAFVDAIKFAERRYDRDASVYQAHPDLHHRLADIFASSKKPARAAERYLHAASAYLEIDDLESAQKMVDAYSRWATPKLDEAAAVLAAIIRIRHSIDDLPKEHFANGGAALQADPKFRWAFGPLAEHHVMARQQFKIRADLAKRAMVVDDKAEAVRLAASAGEAALSVPAMTGPLDVERLRSVAGLVRDRIVIDSRHTPVQNEPELNDDRFGKVWKYGGGRDSGGYEIGWSADLVLAVRLLPRVVAAPEPIRVSVTSGVVTITSGNAVPAADAEALATDLRTVAGVNRVEHRRGRTTELLTR